MKWKPNWSFFTDLPLPRRAISIGAQHVAVAAAARKGGRLTITRAALEPLPPGTVEPRFGEVNIKDKDRVTRAVAQALEKAGLRQSVRFSLAIPRQATRTLIIGLDSLPRSSKELTEVLQWKVESLLAVSMSDLTAAFQALPPTHLQARYLVVAAVNDILAAYEACLRPLGLWAGFVVPAHLGEAAWLQLQGSEGRDQGAGIRSRRQGTRDPGQRLTKGLGDHLLMTADAEELTIMFQRGGEFLSIRSLEFTPDTVADEVHRTLCYYLDKLAPQGASGPEPTLETVLLIGAALDVGEVEAQARALFPLERRPAVQALIEGNSKSQAPNPKLWNLEFGVWEIPDRGLEAIAPAAGLAAMGV